MTGVHASFLSQRYLIGNTFIENAAEDHHPHVHLLIGIISILMFQDKITNQGPQVPSGFFAVSSNSHTSSNSYTSSNSCTSSNSYTLFNSYTSSIFIHRPIVIHRPYVCIVHIYTSSIVIHRPYLYIVDSHTWSIVIHRP